MLQHVKFMLMQLNWGTEYLLKKTPIVFKNSENLSELYVNI